MARACARFARHVLPLAILGDDLGQLALRLGGLAILLGIADHGGIGHLARQFLEARFDLVELVRELHVRLGDDQFAALLRFERHGAVQRVDRDGGLLVEGGCVVMRCSHRPGAVSSARNDPRRLAAKRISS